jgi:hypothetical protein
VGEYGEPPLQNEPPSIKLKIRKILMPSKSSEEKSENNFEYFRGWEWSRTTGTPYFHTIALP